jgi:hypothetical protein
MLSFEIFWVFSKSTNAYNIATHCALLLLLLGEPLYFDPRPPLILSPFENKETATELGHHIHKSRQRDFSFRRIFYAKKKNRYDFSDLHTRV